MLDLLREVRLAWRALVRRPGLTLAALATLALTIGANTAVFSTAYGLLFRPLPYPASERMVAGDKCNRSSRVVDPRNGSMGEGGRGSRYRALLASCDAEGHQ